MAFFFFFFLFLFVVCLSCCVLCRLFRVLFAGDMGGEQWEQLIGCSPTSPNLETALITAQVDPQSATIKRYSNSTVHNFYAHGLSLCFVNDKLDSIDFFFKDKNFSRCGIKTLPYDLTPDTTGKELVEKLGEPFEKGGGITSKMDIWLRWERLQVEVDDRSWESAHGSTLLSFTVF